MQPAKALSAAPLTREVQSFLGFCRVEKGLAANTLSSYRIDLERLADFVRKPARQVEAADLNGHVESLYRSGLTARSVARHITAIRNFFRFLMQEGMVESDPTEFLSAPRQWTTLPKFLNRDELERLHV